MKRFRYRYKFTHNGWDYFRDNQTDRIIKLPENTPRTDCYISHHAVDAEQDLVVLEFFSEVG